MTISEQNHALDKERRQTFGLGLLKGMGVTLKHLFKHNTVIEYPDEKQELPPRTRGVIALKEENCTVCMLCSRECPDWCIYIDSHKETLPPKREGGRPRKRNVLDRFAIDYALCMYCGICVEVCPYDALFWSPEFEYSEYDIRQLTHEKERLADWMVTVGPPPLLEEGAEIAGQPPAAAAAADAAGAATTMVGPTGARPATTTSSAAEARPEQAAVAPKEGTFAPQSERPADTLPEGEQAAETSPARAEAEPARGLDAEVKAAQGLPGAEAQPEPSRDVDQAGTSASDRPADAAQTGAPAAAARPDEDTPSIAAAPPRKTEGEGGIAPSTPSGAPPQTASTAAPARSVEPREDPEEVYRRVLQEQTDKGSSPQVAEARAKVARVKAVRGVRRPAAPVAPDVPLPRAPTQGRPTEPDPPGAPHASVHTPDPGPVAPTEPDEARSTSEAPDDAPATDEASERAEQAARPAAAGGGPTSQADPVGQGAVTSTPKPTDDATADTPGAGGAEDPEAAYQRVLAEERAKGSSEAVAVARAKVARVRAQRAGGGGG